jgi:hypothetical protein
MAHEKQFSYAFMSSDPRFTQLNCQLPMRFRTSNMVSAHPTTTIKIVDNMVPMVGGQLLKIIHAIITSPGKMKTKASD